MSLRPPVTDVYWHGDTAALYVDGDDGTVGEVADKGDGTWTGVVSNVSGVLWETQAATRQEAVDKVEAYWHETIQSQYESAAESMAEDIADGVWRMR